MFTDLRMLVMNGGRERTADDFHELFWRGRLPALQHHPHPIAGLHHRRRPRLTRAGAGGHPGADEDGQTLSRPTFVLDQSGGSAALARSMAAEPKPARRW
jgi:hypothetical protein